jgi:hypothetical protein
VKGVESLGELVDAVTMTATAVVILELAVSFL